MDIQQYYPTPLELGKKLARLIKLPVSPILEPSAGTGDLADAFNKIHSRGWHGSCIFHCIEIDSERAVADSFEGRDSYEDTSRNQQFYLPQPSQNLLMLTSGSMQLNSF